MMPRKLAHVWSITILITYFIKETLEWYSYWVRTVICLLRLPNVIGKFPIVRKYTPRTPLLLLEAVESGIVWMAFRILLDRQVLKAALHFSIHSTCIVGFVCRSFTGFCSRIWYMKWGKKISLSLWIKFRMVAQKLAFHWFQVVPFSLGHSLSLGSFDLRHTTLNASFYWKHMNHSVIFKKCSLTKTYGDMFISFECQHSIVVKCQ